MVIHINNPQQCIWYGTVTTSEPLTVNRDVMYHSENIEEYRQDKSDWFEDLDIDSYKGFLYKEALEDILLLISQSKNSKLLVEKIQEVAQTAINTEMTDYVNVSDFELEEGEYLLEDFKNQWDWIECLEEEATHSLFSFQDESIVIPGKVEGENVKFIKIIK